MDNSDTQTTVDAPIMVRLTGTTRIAIKSIALIAVCIVLFYGQSFFLPVVLAALIALTLSPIVRLGQKIKLPAALSALALIIMLATAITLGAMTLAQPFSELVAEAPQIGAKLNSKLRSIREPMESLNSAGEQVEMMAAGGDDGATQQVVIKQPGLIARAADDFAAIVASTILTLVLTFFLLVSRDMFFKKIVRVIPKLSDKKKALHVANDIERDVSQYLLTVALINSCLGAVIGTTFWLIGMPNPILWGVLAGLLNFLPYVGALLGILVTTGVALITFDSIGDAAFVPGAYLLATVIEGQFVTPLVLGRRFSLNTVVILLSIAFWGFIWGALGVIIAVPLLIVLKAFCDRIEGMFGIGEFISGEEVAETSSD